MKKNELQNIRKKETLDLEKLVKDKKKEIVVTYAKMKVGQEKNLKKIKNLKRDVSQILTIIREMEILKQSKKVKPARSATHSVAGRE